jgi:hypothetical protein
MHRVVLDGRITSTSRLLQSREMTMWWGIGFGGVILYVVLLVTLGLMTLRNGHGWMFFFGIFIPVFWLIGAIMRPTSARAA